MAMADAYLHAIHQCCERYRDMISKAHGGMDVSRWNKEWADLWKFNFDLMFACRDKNISLMKANRWLGYIQGCMIERGLTTVDAERNWTRPLFRPLDSPEEK